MRLVLSVLNVMKEMVTMFPYFFTICAPDSLCFNILQATKFLQSQKDWVKIKVILPWPKCGQVATKTGPFPKFIS